MALNFLNQNRYLDYPFKDGPYTFSGQSLLPQWIVDAGIVMGPLSAYAYQTDVVLQQIQCDGTTVTFTLGPAGGPTLNFAVAASAAFGQVTTAVDAGGPNMAGGFLQTGDLSWFQGNPGTWTGGAPLISTLVTTLYRRLVTSINIANFPNTPYTPPSPCPDSAVVYNLNPVVLAQGLTGDVALSGGRFSILTGATSDNSLTLGITTEQSQADGAPSVHCQDLSVYPPNYAASAPPCSALIFSVAGVGPNPISHELHLEGIRGISVQKTGDHALTVTFTNSVIIISHQTPVDCGSST